MQNRNFAAKQSNQTIDLGGKGTISITQYTIFIHRPNRDVDVSSTKTDVGKSLDRLTVITQFVEEITG